MLNPQQFPDTLRPAAKLIETGKMAEARKLLRPILEADPKNADGWYLVSLTTNQIEQKTQALGRVLKLNPQHAMAREALDDLNAVDDLLSDTPQKLAPTPAPVKPQPTAVPQKPAWYQRRDVQLQLIGVALVGVVILVAFAIITHKNGSSGKLVFEVGQFSWRDVYILPDLHDVAINLTDSQDRVFNGSPALSPDGSQIAFMSDRDGPANIYLMNTDGSNVRQLTFGSEEKNNPAWSPDGRQIAYDKKIGRDAIYIINADGTGDHALITPGSSASWSPNGLQLVFVATAGRGSHLFLINADGTNLQQLTHDKDTNDMPAWSPDGKYIVFYHKTTNFNGFSLENAIYRMNANGTNVMKLADSSFSAAWSPDGKWIIYSSYADSDVSNVVAFEDTQLYIMYPDGSHKTRVSSISPAFNPSWSR